jgi:alkanesulfonate monooxygenase SsuD/methylene tetrahydromethanopterin reductase-like flavin-dependent oxidoreductase (luciferase family)
VTETIGLGTSVLVLPQHNPLELANMLATIDAPAAAA